jgi:hypothetical protein
MFCRKFDMKHLLLTRDQFRHAVFQRDKNMCVICKSEGQDAHHIMERRLFQDGGYYIANGATVCGDCHIKAEQTLISTEELREKAGIKTLILPEHLYDDQRWDKWANPILENGMRLRGELFDDPSVNKVLTPVLHLFSEKVKYPRTYHVPWSPGATSDDRILPYESLSQWHWEVVITEKMDGENTTFYSNDLHARSLDYEPHPSRSKIKALHAQIGYNIPKGFRVCCENLTAVHSIKYTNLKSICQVFSIWDGLTCLNWDDTVMYADLLGLQTVPFLYRGPWDEILAKELPDYLNLQKQEGYVVRPASSFQMRDFRRVVGKYVRQGHVITHGHWMRSQLEFNEVL